MSIRKLNCMELKDTRYSVYPYDGYNLEEILGKFYEAIKECNDLSFSLQEFNNWIISEGLTEEVLKQLTKIDWDNIVNSELYQTVIERLLNTNNRVEEVKNELISQLNNNVSIVNDMLSKGVINVKCPPSGLIALKGDGADEGENIQNLLNLQKILYFPEGVYATGRTLIGYNSLIGDKATIKVVGDDRKLITFSDTNNLKIKGICFEGVGVPVKNNPSNNHLVFLSGKNNKVSIENCVFKNSSSFGLRIGNPNNCIVEKSLFYNCYQGLEFKIESKDDSSFRICSNNKALNNKCEKIAHIGINFQPYDIQTVDNEVANGHFSESICSFNTFIDCFTLGAEFYGCTTNGYMTNNTCIRCGINSYFGSANKHGGLTVKHSKNVIVQGNILDNCYCGIEVLSNALPTSDGYQVDNVNVIGNNIKNCNLGITYFRNCKDCLASNNSIEFTQTAISINSDGYDIINVTIDNNKLNEVGAGIYTRGANKFLKITNNTILNANYKAESSTNRSGIRIDNSLTSDNTKVSNMVINNNIIRDTRTNGNKTFYGIYINYVSDSEIKNNIVVNTNDIRVRRDNCSNVRQENNSSQYAENYPGSGTWEKGDRIINNNPAVGMPKSWICTVTGTPGTWVSEGNL